MKKKPRSREEMLKLYQLIDKEVEAGSTIQAACRKYDVSRGAYTPYRDKMKRLREGTKAKRPATRVVALPASKPETRMMLIVGSPEELAAFARGMQ